MATRVNLYMSPASPGAEEITDYLSNKGLDFHEYDISTDVSAHKHMIAATRGAGGPPVVEVRNQVVFGFDKERLEQTINYELR